jgi:hypothetical protein
MSEIAIILILSVVVLLLLTGNIIQFDKISDLRGEVDTAYDIVRKKEKEYQQKEKELQAKIKEVESEKTSVHRTKEDLFKIEPGDRGVLVDYNLVTTYQDNSKPKHHYTVTFEVEVLEVSGKKLKVKALDYISGDSYANDPANKVGILNVINMKHSWIDKSSLELIIDDAKRRGDKIDQILDENS